MIKPNSNTLYTFFFLCAFLLIIPLSKGQSHQTLEGKRKKLLNDIKKTSSLLGETKKTRAAMLDRYLTLKNQMNTREELILTIQDEVAILDKSIGRSSEVIKAFERDIKQLNEEHGAMLRKAYRQKVNRSKWLFVLSAKDFNQAYQRWNYIKQYDLYRSKQANLILETKNILSQKIENLAQQKINKEQLIIAAEEQKHKLDKELQNKNNLLVALKKDETNLKKELNKKRIAHEHLNVAIENVIQKEIAKKRKAARIPTPSAKKSNPASNTNTNVSPQLTQSFNQNRGRLPWPVSNGVITKQFGKQAHPTLKAIHITNNGIDIRTKVNASVRAVFAGEVVGSQFIPGYDYMLIIKHGEYYTVYSNLKETFVQKGSKIKIQQEIGRVKLNNQSNSAELHFEVWRDKIRLNPEDWIK